MNEVISQLKDVLGRREVLGAVTKRAKLNRELGQAWVMAEDYREEFATDSLIAVSLSAKLTLITKRVVECRWEKDWSQSAVNEIWSRTSHCCRSCNNLHFLSREKLHHLCCCFPQYRLNTAQRQVDCTAQFGCMCSPNIHLCTQSTRPGRRDGDYLLCIQSDLPFKFDDIDSGFGEFLCRARQSIFAEATKSSDSFCCSPNERLDREWEKKRLLEANK